MKLNLAMIILGSFILTIVPAKSAAEISKRDIWREKVFTQLNLTAEQWAQLNEIEVRFKSNSQEIRGVLRSLVLKLDEAMATKDSSKEDLRSISRQIQDLKAKAVQMKFENFLSMREVLNDEQRKKFTELRNERWRKVGSRTSAH